MILAQPPVSEQSFRPARPRCPHDGPKWDGLCGSCLDEQIGYERERQHQRNLEWRAELREARADAAFRFGVLPEDDFAEEWST